MKLVSNTNFKISIAEPWIIRKDQGGVLLILISMVMEFIKGELLINLCFYIKS